MAFCFGDVTHTSWEDFQFLMETNRRNIKKWEDIPPMLRKLQTKDYREQCFVHDESREVIDLMKNFKITELKEKVTNNFVDLSKMTGNKSWKKTWAKEIIKTYKWGFNTFMVAMKSDKTHELYGQIDILLTIQKFM
tara:strand:- start:544 stop:951 length:408 start_codon:yes stop_codon:yes gene_type:complete